MPNLYPSDRVERAHVLLSEGRIGGQFGYLGGRPRKPPVAPEVAHHASNHAREIVTALTEALDPSQPMSTRLKAAAVWLAIEARSR